DVARASLTAAAGEGVIMFATVEFHSRPDSFFAAHINAIDVQILVQKVFAELLRKRLDRVHIVAAGKNVERIFHRAGLYDERVLGCRIRLFEIAAEFDPDRELDELVPIGLATNARQADQRFSVRLTADNGVVHRRLVVICRRRLPSPKNLEWTILL